MASTARPPAGPASVPAAIRILIADDLAPEGAAFLRGAPGVEVTVKPGLAGDALASLMREHDGVVVRSAVKVTAPVLEACRGGRLRAVARAGVGVDNIDLPAATRLGVAVMNSASASTITTAEHAFALMIALARNIGPSYMTMSQGGWDRSRFTGAQLHGRTLGVVGLGRIGRTLAQRALAFGMKVVGFDPFVNAESILESQVRVAGSLDELLEQADIISFHVPKTATTSGMMGQAQFERARRGVLLVNTSRGEVIDEPALLAALESGACGGAALDVFVKEPPPAESPLRRHPRILCTPHLGASTAEAQEAVAVDACRCVLAYLRGEGMPGAVNAAGLNLDLSPRQTAFIDLARRMVSLLGPAAQHSGLERVHLRVRGESLSARADTVARFALAELLNQHLDQPVNVINAPMIADERGVALHTVIATDRGEDRLAIDLTAAEEPRRVEGAIYADGLPRITHLHGYALDMVPAGHMVLLTNDDKPGRIGLVGQMFGDANVNIAEMVIGRRPPRSGGPTQAMMIIKLDGRPDPELLARLRAAPGIHEVAAVELPPVE
jgi:D-3-phosphoglycerate dehydrogenase